MKEHFDAAPRATWSSQPAEAKAHAHGAHRLPSHDPTSSSTHGSFPVVASSSRAAGSPARTSASRAVSAHAAFDEMRRTVVM